MAFLKRFVAIALLVLSLSLTSCVGDEVNLKSYIDTADNYAFLYPNGWLPARVANGPDVVFRDLIEQTENVSVVISSVGDRASLEELGDPTEVGQRLAQRVLAPPESGREAELLLVDQVNVDDKAYYLLEYRTRLAGGDERHNLASAVVNRGKLYTFNASTTEDRWPKVESLFRQVVRSFTVS
jgi:photosystem II oxygen-evolving enhancer protein 2